MTIATRAGVAATAIALAIGLSACGSDTEGEATKAGESSATSETSEAAAPTTTEAPPTSQTPAASPGMTLDQYILDNNIDSKAVVQGDSGAPTITLPFAPGWGPAGPDTPQGAFDAMTLTGTPPPPNPPTIVTFVSKLTGDVDPAKILAYAPNDTLALPDFQGANAGKQSTLAGFEATQIGGFYKKDGVSYLIAQKTVVVPADDGVFVVKITAEGTEDHAMQLMDATAAIDEQATIVP
ncbi:LpqN/LpqT family lipoprotein [Mycobacterium sp. 236(2023)]|uniref:LpqN/LpqT family lipoprotein n=1 Tax=Mycobacterium sp. 236(2023) TaxID=3038163 RepID=UPI0024151142|nr:LpqN/LpqT family lipoprotein [Mycobacterium sp. 236(2023)]MDG4665877.1 LpqN/LpqT family lipoprotein [Mycobacterium sp. 236(2023)]